MTFSTNSSEPRVYIAARFSRRPECNRLGHLLKARGCVITSRWTKPDCDHVLATGLSRQAEDSERQRFALEDVEDVRAANWTISFMEEPRSNTRGGRHVEFGLALALGHRLTIIGQRETVFHHLPQVEQFDTVDQFIASLPDTFAQAAPAVGLEALLEAHRIALHHSNYGDIEGNKRAFAIAADIGRRIRAMEGA